MTDPPLRVLIVEDSPTDAKLVLRELRRVRGQLDFERVEDAPSMSHALDSGTWDVIICDWSMPKFSAIAALELLREKSIDLPFIIVSGTIGEEHAVEAMRLGAHDYVLKDKLTRLAPAVERELREAEARRGHRSSKARKVAILETALDAIVGMSEDGSINEFNPAAERIFGHARASVLGKTLADILVPPRLRDAHRAGLERYLKTREAHVIGKRVELVAQRADGSEFPVEVSIARVGQDSPASFIGFIQDISDRKRAEKILIERMRIAALGAEVSTALTQDGELGDILQRCADAIVRHLGVAAARVWTLDDTQKVLALQGAAGLGANIPGVHARIEVGKREVGRIAHDRRAFVTNDAGNDPQITDREKLVRDGIVAFAGHPLVVGGSLVGVMAVHASDPLTDEVRNGLAATADSVALGIQRKLVELAKGALEEQLRHAQKMEAVGRLAGGVAHDFNNALSVVLTYVELMLDALRAEDPMREDVGEIRKAARRAADLTRQLLMFSRQQVFESRVVDVNELIVGMTNMLCRVLGEDVELIALTSAAGRVRVDPGSIEQLIMNLVVNAKDAMPTGGTVTIATTDVELDSDHATEHVGVSAGTYVVMAITDTGAGIDKATQARIFEPFFTTKDKSKGTGLGLSTAFAIVQQSGGSIRVYSEVGEGTTFKVYLPRVDEEVAAEQQPRSLHLTRRGTETILLVEDEEQVRTVARNILRRNGYQVIEAQHGNAALVASANHIGRIHLLLTDVVMPQMGGAELAKHLADARPDMKVLYMSGYTDDSVVRHGVLAAEIAFLQKPFTPDTLTKKVRTVLDEA